MCNYSRSFPPFCSLCDGCRGKTRRMIDATLQDQVVVDRGDGKLRVGGGSMVLDSKPEN
jgi:hypothetical protein